MKKFLLYFVILSLSLTLISCQEKSIMQTRQIKVNGQLLNVAVAETISQMAKGLSGRQSLAENEGMLFIYPDYQIRYFHMKDMNFPLDIIWIKDNIIAGIEENVPVLTEGKITKVKSNVSVNRVLEINAGWASNYGVRVGDKIEFMEFD